jgi:hypothetical protein
MSISSKNLVELAADPIVKNLVDSVWAQIGREFEIAREAMPAEIRMSREEISFHEDVTLLGYLSLLVKDLPGDKMEIGVWKGKSLCLMSRLSGAHQRILGVDPMALPNQAEELLFYRDRLFPACMVVREFSELALQKVMAETTGLALLHIDGGHLARNVLLDFLLFGDLVVPGGFVVFDDYRDEIHSPEVGPAVDLLRAGGLFKNFGVLGPIGGFENSYVLQKLR